MSKHKSLSKLSLEPQTEHDVRSALTRDCAHTFARPRPCPSLVDSPSLFAFLLRTVNRTFGLTYIHPLDHYKVKELPPAPPQGPECY
eukprot:14749496-Alexandrium_andersonii.AAC.1